MLKFVQEMGSHEKLVVSFLTYNASGGNKVRSLRLGD